MHLTIVRLTRSLDAVDPGREGVGVLLQLVHHGECDPWHVESGEYDGQSTLPSNSGPTLLRPHALDADVVLHGLERVQIASWEVVEEHPHREEQPPKVLGFAHF